MKKGKSVAILAACALPVVAAADLRITEVCASCQPDVPACKDLGWVELHNDGVEAVNLRDYKLVGTNRGKKIKATDKDLSPLLDRAVAPGEYTLVYMGEMFPNGEDGGGNGQSVAEFDYGAYGRIMVVPKKLNQKKYPMVQLYGRGGELLQTVFVPSDLADGLSYTTVPERKILARPTPGAANVADGVAYGPNVSCLYGVKDAADPWRAFPQAKVGVDYAVRLPVNPIDLSEAEEDRIAAVRLIWRVGLGAAVTNDVPMAAVESNKSDGVIYEGAIPGEAFTAAGQLVQFAALITDGAGRTFRSPSFRNPDDGYEWYGTIIEPGDLDSAALQTFHLFVDEISRAQMDKDEKNQDRSVVPYCARVGIYDSKTGLYHDNVRIDLRGNTSGGFQKKSHGLRFNKTQPLVFSNEFTRAEFECRKSSFISEFTDPSIMRQSLSFKVFRDAGLPTPFHYPVRLNLNGAFYQLAFHSERFTDELIEDHYGFDPLGYGYKNVGALQYLNTHAGAIEKKTPDDGRENDLSVLSAFMSTIKGEHPTRAVATTFDLPAWINYLAIARITQETDDADANLSIYYDVNGTGTWMPLCYDLQLSWGQYWGKDGTLADRDEWKSHPFHDGGNFGFKAIWQHEKFRRLYLRRLRTLMDQILKTPGTVKADTPFWDYVVAVTNAAAADVALDRAKWPSPQGQPMYCWPSRMSLAEGVADLWDNYVEPRRRHLFVTHSATNTAFEIGYGKAFNAGIPLPQAPTKTLAKGFSVVANPDGSLVKDGALVISNANPVAVDMSGWKLSKAMKWTLPGGTVVDANDTITIVADRRRYIEIHGWEMTDQIVVGNAELKEFESNPVTLKDAEGTTVLQVYPPPVVRLAGAAATPGTDFCGAQVVVTLAPGFAANDRKVSATLIVGDCTCEGRVDLDAGVIGFDVPADVLSATDVRAGLVTVTAGETSGTCGVVFEQGAVTRTSFSGWIRESAETLGTTGTWSVEPQVRDGALFISGASGFVPGTEMPERSVASLSFRLALGASGSDDSFDANAHAGVMVVSTDAGDFYCFKTADGVVTNTSVAADAGAEVDVVATIDYRVGQVSYAIDGTLFGPFAIGGAATRVTGLNLTGLGALRSLTGDYETRALNANLARVGGREFPTVDAALASGLGGRIDLLWDATWTPTKGGSYGFATGGHRLVIGGDLVAQVKDNGDGTLTVIVSGGEEVTAKPASFTIEGTTVAIGVLDVQTDCRYGVFTTTDLKGGFPSEAQSWTPGTELAASNGVLKVALPSPSAGFFKVVIERIAP